MNRIQNIILGLIVIILSLIAIVVFRYNLMFGETVFQKSLMAGCMHKELKVKNLSDSRDICECYIGSLVEKYSDEEIRYDIDQIKVKDENPFNKCKTEKDNLVAEEVSIDTTKLYQKIGWVNQIDKNTKEEVEAYLSLKHDTLINQFKVFRNGSIDSSMSKFYELKIEGYKDSLIQGEIRFFSPRDSTPPSKIKGRDVVFYYLQRDKDSLIIKEIETDTNYIKFSYRNFDNYTFVGFISDNRWITIDSSDSYLLNRNFFAIDTEASTNNSFVELLK